MSAPVQAVVLAAPGTNRDGDVARALEMAGAVPTVVPLADLRAGARPLADARLAVVAGGFSFADALGSGRLFALELLDAVGDELAAFVDAGRPVLGICNGFQVLVRAGLLPGAGRRAALGHNADGRFTCRWVDMQAELAGPCVWTRGLTSDIRCPVAHGEGRFTCDDDTLEALRAAGQVALRYTNGTNPNGSIGDVAGLCDPTGLVLGLMPHPEDHVHPHQDPLRRRAGAPCGSGLPLFVNGVRHAQEL
jgi:phosphoribosylformylglycinamidine synthase